MRKKKTCKLNAEQLMNIKPLIIRASQTRSINRKIIRLKQYVLYTNCTRSTVTKFANNFVQ